MTRNPPPEPDKEGPWKALLGLLEQQEKALTAGFNHTRSVRDQISALALYDRPSSMESPDIVEVTDPCQMNELLDNAYILACHQVLCMESPTASRNLPGTTLTRSRMARDKGVRIRTILQSFADDGASTTAHMKKLTSIGVQIRTASLLPFRMIVVDDSLALLSPPKPIGAPGELLVIRHPTVVQLLQRVFDYCWDGTTNYRSPDDAQTTCLDDTDPELVSPGTPRLNGQQQVILQLWAKGQQDATIARELQVSPRTLRRIISALLRRLGVTTRFEAGVVAARAHGLLESAHRCPQEQSQNYVSH